MNPWTMPTPVRATQVQNATDSRVRLTLHELNQGLVDLLRAGLDLSLDDGLEHHVAVDVDARGELQAVGTLGDGPQALVGDAHGRAGQVPQAVLEVDQGVGAGDVGVEDGVRDFVADRDPVQGVARGARLDIGRDLLPDGLVGGDVLVLPVAGSGLEVGHVVVQDLEGLVLADAGGNRPGVGDLKATWSIKKSVCDRTCEILFSNAARNPNIPIVAGVVGEDKKIEI